MPNHAIDGFDRCLPPTPYHCTRCVSKESARLAKQIAEQGDDTRPVQEWAKAISKDIVDADD